MNATPARGAVPMPSQQSDAIAAWLLGAAGAEATSEQVVATIVAACQDIDGALTPIIGPRGVAALYHRSVHLASRSMPLLAGVQAATPTTMDLGALKVQLSALAPAAAAAAGGLLLHTLYEVLGALIGASLTKQLLHKVWPKS